MKIRNQTEIQEEIAKLKALRNKIPARNFLGESNYDAIDAEIFVLSSGSDIDEQSVNKISGKSRVVNHAFGAYDWMVGVLEDSPSEDWSVLFKGEVS